MAFSHQLALTVSRLVDSTVCENQPKKVSVEKWTHCIFCQLFVYYLSADYLRFDSLLFMANVSCLLMVFVSCLFTFYVSWSFMVLSADYFDCQLSIYIYVSWSFIFMSTVYLLFCQLVVYIYVSCLFTICQLLMYSFCLRLYQLII